MGRRGGPGRAAAPSLAPPNPSRLPTLPIDNTRANLARGRPTSGRSWKHCARRRALASPARLAARPPAPWAPPWPPPGRRWRIFWPARTCGWRLRACCPSSSARPRPTARSGPPTAPCSRPCPRREGGRGAEGRVRGWVCGWVRGWVRGWARGWVGVWEVGGGARWAAGSLLTCPRPAQPARPPPPNPPPPLFSQVREVLARLTLDDAAVWRLEAARERTPGAYKAPLPVKAFYLSLCWLLDVLYAGRPVQAGRECVAWGAGLSPPRTAWRVGRLLAAGRWMGGAAPRPAHPHRPRPPPPHT